MNKTIRRILWIGIPTAVMIAIACLLLIPLAMFAPPVVKDVCLSFSETAETIREGEAHGFRVGATKERTFADARDLLAQRDFGWLSPWVDRDTYYATYPALFDYQPPEKVGTEFGNWESWKIRGFSDGETKEIQLFFAYPSNTLKQIDWTRHSTSGWPTEYPDEWPPRDGLPRIRKGMPSREVFDVLAQLAGHTEYEGIEMAPPYLAWRKIVDPTPDEFWRIRPFDEWYVRKLKTPFSTDTIHLRFTDDQLTEIGRYRNYEPFPF